MRITTAFSAVMIVQAMALMIPVGAIIPSTNIIQGQRLVQASYCSHLVLIGAHRYRTLQVRSKVDCVSQCQPDDACVSIVYDGDTKECHLGDSKAFDNCSNMEPGKPGAIFYQEPPPCGEGEIMAPSGLCVCAPGFTGTPCARYFHNCDDIKKYGDWTGDDVYTVYPLRAPQPFEVYCRHISATRTYIMDRRKSSEDFNRPWLDYRNGFGYLTKSYWLGLEKIYALTADRSYEMRVNLKMVNKSVFLQEYKQFKITDEPTGYRLLFNQSFPNGPNDCLLPLLNARFSTYDHDEDEATNINCAALRKGGFWYRGSGCSTCNPHGILYQPSDGVRLMTEDEAFWDNVLGPGAVDKVSMYLLPQTSHN